MTPAHWKKVNGFPNDFFGWGGEDDDLLQRLKQNNLGKGVQTHLGHALLRPQKGHGRFTSLSASHTLRIARDQKVLLKHLEGIVKGSDRWKRDGLNSLVYTVISDRVTTPANDPSVEFHRVRVRRGRQKSWQLSKVLVMMPASVCNDRARSWRELGEPILHDISELRTRIASIKLPNGCKEPANFAQTATIVAVDLAGSVARIVDNDETLESFFRQLFNPSLGVLWVTPQDAKAVQREYTERNRLTESVEDEKLAEPATVLVCWGRHAGKSETVVQLAPCKASDDWEWKGAFVALEHAREGMNDSPFCISKKAGHEAHDVSRVKAMAHCDDLVDGQKWEHVHSFYLPQRGSEPDTPLEPPMPKRRICVRDRAQGVELAEDSPQPDKCSALIEPLSIEDWSSVWGKTTTLLKHNLKGCHLFACSKRSLKHIGGRLVSDQESGNR
eukprot:gnl/TRDRNA2_/TRDRNA2_156712_c2_seq1.p1 gnl/TRDRNA2_/TRDRNA2_156712_c2~~gnl/TRDRNA2_/TRDRNA2_156712_c2_seq1.p1  ORF type:complete len:465 (+),score=85.94 gnl/TRDRNA2_/TRDRNA2_156712_c2_seq1:67-1395(+)